MIGWSYDAAGNLLSDGTTSYSYDALNRALTTGSTTNSYNAAGVLVQQGTTRYVQDLAAPLSQILSDGTATSVYGQERLFALSGGTRTWYAADALGSVRRTLPDSGVAGSSVNYDPWGQVQSGTIPTFGFTGELQQGRNVYLRARWYNGRTGTFTSRDSFAGWPERPYSLQPYQSFRWQTRESLNEIPYSHHLYQYAYSNPVLNTDPSGMVVPVCPIGYKTVIKDGQFAGCEDDPSFPSWLGLLKGSLGPLPVGGGAAGSTLPQTGGQAAGKALEACGTLLA